VFISRKCDHEHTRALLSPYVSSPLREFSALPIGSIGLFYHVLYMCDVFPFPWRRNPLHSLPYQAHLLRNDGRLSGTGTDIDKASGLACLGKSGTGSKADRFGHGVAFGCIDVAGRQPDLNTHLLVSQPACFLLKLLSCRSFRAATSLLPSWIQHSLSVLASIALAVHSAIHSRANPPQLIVPRITSRSHRDSRGLDISSQSRW
jgi:hypothetical protein